MKKQLIAAVSAVLLSCAPFVAHGATLSSTFQVLANVTATAACTNFSVSDINFGTLAGTSSASGISVPPATGSGSFAITCAAATPWTMTLSPGNAGTESASMSGRYMLNGTNHLNYQLVIVNGPNCSSPVLGAWGDGTNGTIDFSFHGSIAGSNGFTCALLPAQTVAATGAYSDTIVATLTF